MKKYFIYLITTLFCLTFFSCAGGGSAGGSSAEGLSINIKTQKNGGRAASNVAYTFTITLSGSSYSRTATKTGNPVTFHFDDVPTEENIDTSVTVKLGSVLMFSGNKVINIDSGENKITIDLSNQLEETIQIPYSEIDNIDTIIKKSTADSPTIIITDSCSDIAPILTEIQTGYQLTGKKTNLNLLNTGKTTYTTEDLTNISSVSSCLGDVMIAEGASIAPTSTAIPENISCSGIVIKLPDSSSYASLIMAIENSKNLSNVTFDFNNKISDVRAIGTHPTKITGLLLTGVTKINADAFKYWSGLRNSTINIPASVTYIESHSFDVVTGNYTGNVRLTYELDYGWKYDGTGSPRRGPSADEIVDAHYNR